MEISLSYGSCFLVCLVVCAWFHIQQRIRSSNYPLGPYPLPIIGNILEFGRNPHKSLAKLSTKYGPLMYFKLGSSDTIIIASPELAKQVLVKQEQLFSTRDIPIAARSHDFHKFSMAFLPIGDQWRALRKICREEVFSKGSLDLLSQGFCENYKLQKLRDFLGECSEMGRVVYIGDVILATLVNLMSTRLFSLDLGGYGSELTCKMKGMVLEFNKVLGTPSLADVFPVLKLVDPQGLKRKSEICFGKLLDFFQEMMNGKLESRSTKQHDFLDVLLSQAGEGSEIISYNQIIYLLVDLFVGGTETTSVTIEWAMTELLRNPDKVSKLRDELHDIIGENIDKLEKVEISKLPYLQAVIKETLRCHPIGPFLVPSRAAEKVEINGYIIPKGAQIIVNIWAISRNPYVWSNPDSFEPERFLERKTDYRGQDYEFIPFGSGRRICPGLPMAHRMLHLILASLIHSYDWKLEDGMKPDEVDLTEKFELPLKKLVPLKAVPIRLRTRAD